ncbi:nucleotidyltransferase substrate binding protein [bacterium]|nr:nucleotidyltransferase substrate binding protein [bacterium]
MTKLDLITEQFQKALSRLKEALDAEENDFIRDSAIQRFEFTLDLSWKSLKVFLEEKYGVVCNSPKRCFREAFKQGIIEYNEIWLEMVDWRNEIVYTYQEEFAEKLYNSLPKAVKFFEKLIKSFQKEKE